MKNTNTIKRLSILEDAVFAIANKLGIGSNDDTEVSNSAPKTSARMRSSQGSNSNFAVKAKKGQRVEDVVITLTDAMVEGRMKLPARMFTKGSKVVVEGHTLTQQPADQNRSTKFNPAIFGYEVSAGDIMTFTHEGGRDWSVEVEEGSRKRKSASKKGSAKPASSKTNNKRAEREKPAKKLGRSEQGQQSVSSLISKFAEIAIENANTKGFKQNDNIKATGTFEEDARVYLTTAQNQQFRKGWKNLGLSLKKAVGLLNAAVYED